MWWNLVEQSGTNMKSTNKKECNIEKSINTPQKYSREKVDDKVPMWHQKDGIGKMYNIIEDNVTRRSTHDTKNVTTKDKLIDDQHMAQQGWKSYGTNEINSCRSQ